MKLKNKARRTWKTTHLCTACNGPMRCSWSDPVNIGHRVRLYKCDACGGGEKWIDQRVQVTPPRRKL